MQPKTRSELTSRMHEGLVTHQSRPSRFGAMPERCSPARVRFAAPESGAPLPAARRSGNREHATGGSGGITRREEAFLGRNAGPLRIKSRTVYIELLTSRPSGSFRRRQTGSFHFAGNRNFLFCLDIIPPASSPDCFAVV